MRGYCNTLLGTVTVLEKCCCFKNVLKLIVSLMVPLPVCIFNTFIFCLNNYSSSLTGLLNNQVITINNQSKSHLFPLLAHSIGFKVHYFSMSTQSGIYSDSAKCQFRFGRFPLRSLPHSVYISVYSIYQLFKFVCSYHPIILYHAFRCKFLENQW